jgi:hypothetical protein
MIALVFTKDGKGGNGGNGGDGGPPPRRTRPKPSAKPLTPEQIRYVQHELTRTLEARPFLHSALCELLDRLHATNEGAEDRAVDLLDVFAGNWRHSYALMQALTFWSELRAPAKSSIGLIASAWDDDRPHAYDSAIESLTKAMTPEQVAAVAAVFNSARITGTKKQPADALALAQTITDALALMDRPQLAALAPVVVAMIDQTRERADRLRAAVRHLLMHCFDIEDWISLVSAAIRRIRGDRQ